MEGLNGMEGMMRQLRQLKARSTQASLQPQTQAVAGRRPRETIRQQVQARLALAVTGTMMQTLSRSFSGGGFESAPVQSPPIAGGMTETVAKIKEIGLKQGTPSEEEFKQVSTASIILLRCV